MFHTNLVVIQTTPFCNINCRYCYLAQRSLTKRISITTLTHVFKSLFAFPYLAEELSIVWHLGEPLVIPREFYEQAFQMGHQYNTRGLKLRYSFQTNATLITQEWCDFFKKHQMQIGVSLDGPEHIHDAQRVDRQGKGTFQKVMRGVELLEANDIPYTIIAVITKNSMQYPDELWQFFRGLKCIRVGFNVEEAEGANKQSSLQSEEDIHQYKWFLKRFFTLNAQAGFPIALREYELFMEKLERCSPLRRMQTNLPISLLSFDYQGNMSTFSPELSSMTHPEYGDFAFGNVATSSLLDIFRTPKFLAIQDEIHKGVCRCLQECPYFAFCGGGSPSSKLAEHNSFNATETMTCRLNVQAVVDAQLDYLEERQQELSSSKRVG